MTKRQHRKPPAFSTLVLLAAVAFCQNHPTATSPTSEVKGVVTDTTGAVIPHAEVAFKGDSDTIKTQTARDGSFDLTLPSGRYVVTIAQSGFKVTRVLDFQVRAPALAVLNVVLQVGDPKIIVDPSWVEVPTLASDLPSALNDAAASLEDTGNIPAAG
jgi:hypothetical protein